MMNFEWAEDWFCACIPAFSCLLEGAERVANGENRKDGEDREGRKDGKQTEFAAMWNAMSQLALSCAQMPQLVQNGCLDYLENMRYQFAYQAMGQAGGFGAAVWKASILELREAMYFWGCVAGNEERQKAYWENEFVPHHCRLRQNPNADVTIFVPAYGQLAYTKQCIKSILEHTDLQNCELLLCDHGSEDETYDYFCSVPQAHVVRLPKNVRMGIFSFAFRLCGGKQFAFVSNDTIVTKDWLPHLQACLQAKKDALSATPITPYTSNLQALTITQAESANDFAQNWYTQHQGEWKHRARIMPVIALYNVAKLEALGFADRYFQTMEFWDDDVSLRCRRKGWKQYLCQDVYCHHFGSVTGSSAWAQTLAQGRDLFFKKHGVDAWGQGACMAAGMAALLPLLHFQNNHKKQKRQKRQATVLAVQSGFGDGMFALADTLQAQEIEPLLYSITEAVYLKDVLPFVTGIAVLEQVTANGCAGVFSQKRFDVIFVEGNIHMAWQERLAEGGYILAELALQHLFVDTDCKEIATAQGWGLWQKQTQNDT